MLAIIAFLTVVALLGALDWAALKWGKNSRKIELLERFEGR
jgi:hypothetical protein